MQRSANSVPRLVALEDRSDSGFQFLDYSLDVSGRYLSRNNRIIPLPPKVFDTLLVLVEKRGRVVEKEELMQRIWPDTFVEEANLSVNISALRKVLGEKVGESRFIETIPKRGYRFVAEVSAIPVEEADLVTRRKPEAVAFLREVSGPEAAVADSTLRKTPSRRERIGRHKSLLLMLAFSLVFSIIIYKSFLQPKRESRPFTIAILPFQNLKPDSETDFLKISLPDSVISRLSQVRGVKVRPTASIVKYLGHDINPKSVAEELRADFLLLCNYVKEGDELKFSPQLIDARADEVVWSDEIRIPYTRLASVKTILKERITEALKVAPIGEKRLAQDPQDPEAFEFYLRGIDRILAEDFSIAIEMLSQATEIDPNYAPAWMQLGRAYTAYASTQFGGKTEYEKAAMAYDKVLQIDPENLDVLVFQANLFTDTNQVEQAVPLLRRVIAADPEQARAHWVLNYAYRYGGMIKESIEEGEQAFRLDPALKLTRATFNSYLYTGQYEKFLATLPKEPNKAFTFFYRGFAYYHLKDKERAISDFERAYQMDASLLQTQVGKALSYALEGRKRQAEALLRETERNVEQQGLMDGEAIYKVAQAYEAIGEHQAALRVLRLSIERGFFCYSYFIGDPLMENLRADLGYQALLAQAKIRAEAFQRQFGGNP
jgi:DNA-binding winged helix-turn-helix (wHTH) protein/tetratricopeptide (TPR) repeat protein